MTYIRKKVAIEAQIPDGATHYEVLINRGGESCIDWYKQADDRVYWWEWMRKNWVVAFSEPYTETTIKPIEVVE